MRRYETKEVTRSEKHLVEQRCDLCGIAAAEPDSWGGGSYQVDETEIKVTVKQKEGSSYPEGGMGTEYRIDLCPACFKDRVIPWLVSQGAAIKQEDWDW